MTLEDAGSDSADAMVTPVPTQPPAMPACVVKPEVCNGMDEDCDGVTDNGLKNACGAACGAAVPPEDCGTSKDDNCDGKVNEGCVPPPPSCVPTSEVCDGKDSDCDGIVDNGVLNACGKCGSVPVETCNGMDDNCNGQIDEGVKNACDKCGVVPAEVCDGKDNDCDGKVDDGVTNACGTCGAVPVETCDGQDNDCNGVIDNGVKNACGACGAVPVETCDGQDNDCNGVIDNGVKNACGTCGAVPAEVCDGTDNDCDGMVDEGFNARWFADCDLDGFTAAGMGTASCTQPTATAACTTWRPAASPTADCNDADARVHPGASPSPSSSVPNPSEGPLLSLDIDCSGRVEKPSEWQYFGAAGQWITAMLPLCPSSTSCDGATIGKCYKNTSSPGAVLSCGYTEIEVFSSSSCSIEVATARMVCK